MIKYHLELDRGNAYLTEIRQCCEVAIKKAFDEIPAINWFSETEV